MSTMLIEIYDALKEAGASEEKARAAAASLTGRDDRLDGVERRLDQVEHRLDQVEHRLDQVDQRLDRLEQKVDKIDAGVIQLAKDMAVGQAQIGLLKWMNGIVIAGVAAPDHPSFLRLRPALPTYMPIEKAIAAAPRLLHITQNRFLRPEPCANATPSVASENTRPRSRRSARTSMYLFGSTARDEAGAASDLDLFIDYDKDSRFSAIELLRIKHYLSDALGIEADVTTRDGLHPLIRDEIVSSAERVF